MSVNLNARGQHQGKKMVDWCLRQDTGLDGPLVRPIRSILMLLFYAPCRRDRIKNFPVDIMKRLTNTLKTHCFIASGRKRHILLSQHCHFLRKVLHLNVFSEACNFFKKEP